MRAVKHSMIHIRKFNDKTTDFAASHIYDMCEEVIGFAKEKGMDFDSVEITVSIADKYETNNSFQITEEPLI